MRAIHALPALLLVVALAGCGGDDAGEGTTRARADGSPGERSVEATNDEERVIRNWVNAVGNGKFDLAARYFAPGAIVDQGEEMVLRGRADAVRFNRALPCRAEVTDFEDEGSTTLAAFRLREGRDGGCAEGGRARVRFVIRDGLIKEWRQLPDAPIAPGDSA